MIVNACYHPLQPDDPRRIGASNGYGVNAESIELGPLPDILGYKKC